MPSEQLTKLDQNTKLKIGPGTLYTIKGEAGRGGSCIVYDAVYQTNAGDMKLVRIKECYPFDIPLNRESSGKLSCPDSAEGKFADAKSEMYDDFRLCNRLFYAEAASDAIIITINIYEANNTVYIVSTWSRENVLSADHFPPASRWKTLSRHLIKLSPLPVIPFQAKEKSLCR